MRRHLLSLMAAVTLGFLAGYFIRPSSIGSRPRPIIEEQITTEDLNASLSFNNLLVAANLRAGKSDWVYNYLDKQMLPVGVRFFASNRTKIGVQADYYIWRVNAYYRENGLPIPDDIKAILASAPQGRPDYAGKVAEFAGAPIEATAPPLPPAPR